MLDIDPAKICFIIVKTRELHAKVPVENPVDPDLPEPASNASDDAFRSILEDFASDATYQELREFLDGLNRDERVELLALMWLGRGDYTLDEWADALAEADNAADANESDYLMGTPLVSDYLEEGLNQHGYSCDEYEV
jgi:hypothetical protein